MFRSCTPLLVSMLDYLFLGRELPSPRSFIALMAIVGGALGYVSSDRAFQMHGLSAYVWVSLYLAVLCFVLTYGKQIVSTVNMQVGGRVGGGGGDYVDTESHAQPPPPLLLQ